MMRLGYSLWVVVFLSVFATLIQADDGQQERESQPKPEPIKLTGTTFHAATSRGTWLIKFFSPYCPHCVKMAPDYQGAFEDYALSTQSANGRDGFSFASVDCVTEGDLCSRVGITGYPTLKVYDNGLGVEDYDMGASRKREDLLEYAKSIIKKKFDNRGQEPDLVRDNNNYNNNKDQGYEVKGENITPLNPLGLNLVLTPDSFNSSILRTIDNWVVRLTYDKTGNTNMASAASPAKHSAWDSMASTMQGSIRVGSLNCYQYKTFCRTAFRRYIKQEEVWYYVGTRAVAFPEALPSNDINYEAKLIEFANNAIENRMMPHLNDRDLDTALTRVREGSEESYTTFLYLYDDMWFDEDFAALEQFAVSMVGLGYVYKSNSKFLAKRYGVTQFPALLSLREAGTVVDAYPESTLPNRMRNQDLLWKWGIQNYLPTYPQLTLGNMDAILSEDRMVVVVALDPTAQDTYQRTRSEIKSTIAGYRTQRKHEDTVAVLAARDRKQSLIDSLKQKLRPNPKAIEKATLIKVKIPYRQPVQFVWADITNLKTISWRSSRSKKFSGDSQRINYERGIYLPNEPVDPETGAAVVIINNNRMWSAKQKGLKLVAQRETLLDIISKVLGERPLIKGVTIVPGIIDRFAHVMLALIGFSVFSVITWRWCRRCRVLRPSAGQGLLDGKLE